MSTYQRVALFILFDSMETDLVGHLRALQIEPTALLVPDERARALPRLQRRESAIFDPDDDFELINGLDLGEKYQVLLRHKSLLSISLADYFLSIRTDIERLVPVRNATMHGRPLTTSEYATGFATAEQFIGNSLVWPSLADAYSRYTSDPHHFLANSVVLLDRDNGNQIALNNLPVPDYEDTGFVPRPELERDLKKKLRGRHPVVTVLGEGGSGKSALALQTLYGMLHTNDHGFDAIVWVSAKSSKLTVREVERIEGAITTSLGIFEEIADTFEPGEGNPIERVNRLLTDNRILLVIDNLETIIDEHIRAFAENVPGESKLLLTSRVPLGLDLTVEVGDFSENEARGYIKRLVDSYSIAALRGTPHGRITYYINRLGSRPLLLKWFALGVLSGLDPDRIVSDPTMAVAFCVENIVDKLSHNGQKVATMLAVMSKPCSAAVIRDVTGLTALEVESALSELSRFSLIALDQSTKYERAYNLRPLVKVYITRVLGVSDELSSQYLLRSRQIEGMLQSERGSRASHRYDRKSYVVRSKTEAIAASNLRKAYSRARQRHNEEADRIIDECKIIAPDYFEVYRTEAFVAYEFGDIARAISAYDTALEIDPSQPQLHYWYSGFLQRALEDYKASEEQLSLAMALDPDRPEVLREYARVKLFQYDFDGASEVIAKLKSLEFKSIKDETIAADLEAQIYARDADQAVRNGDFRRALTAIVKLFDHLNETDSVVIDRSFVEHVQKVIPVLDDIRNSGVSVDNAEVALLENKIDALARAVFGSANSSIENKTGRRVGNLKEDGRQAHFGFLVDVEGTETFVHRSDVPRPVWELMCKGEAVFYSITQTADGRERATNVTLRQSHG